MRLAALVVGLALAGLTQSDGAAAHVTADPTFVTAGKRQTITLLVPNERKAQMNGFTVTVPDGLAIVDAQLPANGWPSRTSETTVRWSGCCLAPATSTSFGLTLMASANPGDVRLEAAQHFRDGEDVRWPVPLTVLPAEKSSGNTAVVLLVAAVGLLVTVGLVGLAWRRRAPPLR